MATWTETRRWACDALWAATFTILLAVAFGAVVPASAQPAQGSGVRCIRVSERAGRKMGCWITATEALGELPQAPFWHLDAYPTRAAAEAAKGPRGTVVESLGRVW